MLHPYILESLLDEEHEKEKRCEIDGYRIERSQHISHPGRFKKREYENTGSYNEHIPIDRDFQDTRGDER